MPREWKILKKITAPDLARHVVFAWLVAVAVEFLLLPEPLRDLAGLAHLQEMSLLRVVVITGILTLALTYLGVRFPLKNGERWGVVAAFFILSAAGIEGAAVESFTMLCLFCIAGFVVFGIRGWNGGEEICRAEKKAHWAFAVGTGLLAVAFTVIISAWTVARVHSFSTPTFDFGLFSQMFHYMRTTGQPLTTLERDGLLSHFAVHMSPIYYLMLPFYAIAPTPDTLQVLQAAVMASAVIPLWLIGKSRGFSGLTRMLLCAVLLLMPAFAGGVGYDLHENCFLTPLILWLFYGIEKKSIPITAVGAVLTLMVKEDAAVYVAVAGLYLLVKTGLRGKKADRQDLLTGAALLAVSLAWFFAVTGYLAKSGDGVMTYRYDNFIYDGSGSLFTVIKAVVMNPLKAFYECVDQPKLTFINLTLLPLLCLPLFTRRYERYLLLIPYVLVNLMSDWQYQYNIFFQYTFGSNAFLIYLVALNVSDFRANKKQIAALAVSAAVAFGFFTTNIIPRVQQYQQTESTYRDYYDGVRAALDKVPEDASVATVTFYTTYLSQRDILYDLRYCATEHILEAEYVVLKVTSDADYQRHGGYENVVRLLEKNGYTISHQHGNVLVIYEKTSPR